MKHKKHLNDRRAKMKKRILTIFSLLLFFITIVPVGAVVWVNNFGGNFPGEKAVGIENLVIEGSALYFKANADIMKFCAGIEILPDTEYDFAGASALVQSAREYLKKAREKYLQAVQTGIAAGYVQTSVNQLKTFDYDGFAAEQELNGTVNDRVKAYLAAGDVTGFYQATADGLEALSVILEGIGKDLQNKTKPQIPAVWDLIQKLSELTLFGNYGTVAAQTAYGH